MLTPRIFNDAYTLWSSKCEISSLLQMGNGVCLKELGSKSFGKPIASIWAISCALLSQLNNQWVELSINVIIECNIQIHCITLHQSTNVASYCCNSNINKHTKFTHSWYRPRNGLTIIFISLSLLHGIYFYEAVFSYIKRGQYIKLKVCDV